MTSRKPNSRLMMTASVVCIALVLPSCASSSNSAADSTGEATPVVDEALDLTMVKEQLAAVEKEEEEHEWDAWNHLIDAMAAGQYSNAELRYIANWALDHQDPAEAYNEKEWSIHGEPLHIAREFGAVDDDRWNRYLDQMWRMNLKARPFVSLGDSIPVQHDIWYESVYSTSTRKLEVTLTGSYFLGEHRLAFEEPIEFRPSRGKRYFRLKLNTEDFNGQPIEPGTYLFGVEGMATVHPWWDPSATIRRTPFRWSTPVAIVPAHAESAWLAEQVVEQNPDSVDQMQRAITADSGHIYYEKGRRYFWVAITARRPPVDLAFIATVDDGRGEPLPIGTLAVPAHESREPTLKSKSLPADRVLPGDTVTIILQPDIETASETVDIVNIWPKKIVLSTTVEE